MESEKFKKKKKMLKTKTKFETHSSVKAMEKLFGSCSQLLGLGL